MWRTFYYGVCYYPEHWDPKCHRSDIQRMALAGFNVVRMGEGAWASWEPEEGRYQFDLFDRVIDLCRKHDIKVIMGTPTYCAPAWVSAKYPEVLRWNFERIPMKHGSRRNLNYTSPTFIDLSDKLCTALAQHYKGEKQIIGWQLDNEFNCHMDVSYAPSDTIAFREWLRRKYRTLDRLNKAWGAAFWSQTYTDWDQLDLPHPTAACMNPTQLLDETRFISDCVVRFAKRQADTLRAHNPKWLITHNGLFSNVNGPHLVNVLDFFSHDQYPLFASEWTGPAVSLQQARSLAPLCRPAPGAKPDAPPPHSFAILEQQSGPGGQMQYLHRTPRPGEMRLWAWQSIAHGARFLSFFRWRTCPYGSEQHWHGLLDPDNRDNRRLAEAKLLGAEIRKLPPAFFDAPLTTCIAVLRDFDNEANDRRINTYIGDGRHDAARLLAQLARRHVPADIVWPSSNLAGYRLLFAPHIKIVTREIATKLAAYVKSGGVLVLGAQSGLKNINCHTVESPLPGLLRTLAGVEIEDWTTLSPGETRSAALASFGPVPGVQPKNPADRTAFHHASLPLNIFVERLKPISAKVLARWTSDDPLLAAAPALTCNPLGKGAVYYVGGYWPAAAITPLLDLLLPALNIRPLAIAHQNIETLARATASRRWLVLLNHSAAALPVSGLDPGKDILSGSATSHEISLPPYGVAVLEQPTRQPATPP